MKDGEVISWLLTQPGWFDYSGDASYQAALRLPNGKLLRVGITDDDVTSKPGLWCDMYEGLQMYV